MAFDFTEAQWREIRSAVRDGCAQPARFKERLLLGCANWYLDYRPRYRSASARSAAWKRVARLMRQTRAAMAIADPMEHLGPVFEDSVELDRRLERGQRFADLRGREAVAGVPLPRPRAEYFRDALSCWTDAGGRLRFSRVGPETKEHGRLGGPTVRYLQAVTRPVMKSEAPTLEGIRNIIERHATIVRSLNTGIHPDHGEKLLSYLLIARRLV